MTAAESTQIAKPSTAESKENHGVVLRKKTVPQPFNLSTTKRATARAQALQDKTNVPQEKKESGFKARPAPQFRAPSTTPRAAKTVPEPFNLTSSKKIESRPQSAGSQKSSNNQFKARPYKQRPAFVIAKSERPLTTFSEFSLSMESRLAERRKFDVQQAVREVEKIQKEEQERKAREEKERLEIAELRKTMVPHINKKD